MSGVCPECGVTRRGGDRPKTGERGYDNKWRTLSERFRANNPVCHVCLYKRRVRPADAVHHIIPIKEAPELRLSVSNLISVCVPCHAAVESDRALAVLAKELADSEDEGWDL